MVRSRESVRESVEQIRLGLPVSKILPQRCSLQLLSLGQEIVDILAGLCRHSLVIGRPVDSGQGLPGEAVPDQDLAAQTLGQDEVTISDQGLDGVTMSLETHRDSLLDYLCVEFLPGPVLIRPPPGKGKSFTRTFPFLLVKEHEIK